MVLEWYIMLYLPCMARKTKVNVNRNSFYMSKFSAQKRELAFFKKIKDV